MMSKWGGVKGNEYYDPDDEGYEDPASAKGASDEDSRNPRIKRAVQSREPPASVGITDNSEIGPREEKKAPFSPRKARPVLQNMAANVDRSLGSNRSMQPPSIQDDVMSSSEQSTVEGAEVASSPLARLTLSGSPGPGDWGELWDGEEDDEGGGLDAAAKKARATAAKERRQRDLERALPLTLDDVALRYRNKRPESTGAEAEAGTAEESSLFVGDDDPLPTFEALLDRVSALASEASGAPEGSQSDFRALLVRNTVAELAGRAAGSGTRAVDFTSKARPSLRLGESDAEMDELMAMLRPTRVQAQAAEVLGTGGDALLCAPTGSGKTLAFLLPLLVRISDRDGKNGPSLLVVAPGRELAIQISAVCSRLLEGSHVRCLALIGGANVNRQLDKLKSRTPQVIVGTPGRLAELALGRKRLKLGGVQGVVVDEVDGMLREPHRRDLEALLYELGNKRGQTQYVVASATGGGDQTRKAVSGLLGGRALTPCGARTVPKTSGNRRISPLPTTVEHAVLILPKHKMLSAIKSLLNTEPYPEAAVVFVSDSRRVELVCEKLLDMNVIAAPLHGDSSKEDRTDITRRLGSGRIGLVVTTELAARGLDAPVLSHVINLDLPTDASHYAHRAGRVGRGGRAGIVVTLATPQTGFVVEKFAKELDVKIPRAHIYASKLLVMPTGDPGDETGAA